MNPQERKIIDNLFDKLGHAELQASPREPVAEAHIRSHIDNQPAAPYLMAQTIVAQGQALGAAQTRLAALKGELTRHPAGGGFLSGLFGGGASDREAGDAQGTARPEAGASPQLPGRGMAQARPGRGGGFLAGATQTALGTTGGILLGSMIGGAFGGDEAEAAHAAEAEHTPADDVAMTALTLVATSFDASRQPSGADSPASSTPSM